MKYAIESDSSSLRNMECAGGLLIGGIAIVWIGLTVASAIGSIFLAKLIFEGVISSVTSAYVLCETMNKTANIICPKPWKYDTYKEAMTSTTTIADTLYNIYIALMIITAILSILGAFTNKTQKGGYQSV